MNPIEAYRVMADWQRLLVYGADDRLDRLMVAIEGRLPGSGWEPDPDRPPKPHCMGTERFGGVGLVYSFRQQAGTDGRPRFGLGLRRRPQRFQGVRPELVGPVAITAYADQATAVAGFRAGVLDPVLAMCGLTPIPDVFVTSRLPDRFLDLLLDFSDEAGRTWPLTPNGEQAWRAVTISAFRGGAAIDREELIAWLSAVGWSAAAAAGLAGRYFTDASLLSEYDEVAKAGATTATTTAPPRVYT